MLLETVINEGATLVYRCSFFDSANTPLVPTAIEWALYDEEDDVVRSGTIQPAASVSLMLLGSDNVCGFDKAEAHRKLVIRYKYSSDLGSGLDDSAVAEYRIVAVPGGYQP